MKRWNRVGKQIRYSRYNINRNLKDTFKRHNILMPIYKDSTKGINIKKYALNTHSLLIVAAKCSRIFPATVY